MFVFNRFKALNLTTPLSPLVRQETRALVLPNFNTREYYTNAAPTNANGNTVANVGQGLFSKAIQLRTGRGSTFNTPTSATTATLVAGFYIRPGSPSYTFINCYYSGGRGASVIDITYDSTTGSLSASLAEANYQANLDILLVPSNAAGRFISIAVAGSRATSVAYAAVNGQYVGQVTGAAGTAPSGSTIQLNRGNGFNGANCDVYYIGARPGIATVPNLIELSKNWSPYTNTFEPVKAVLFFPIGGTNYAVSVSENVAALVTETAATSYVVSSSDSAAITDTQAITLVISVSLTESSGLTDTQAVLATFAGSTSESINLVDSQNALSAYNQTVSEVLSISDTYTANTNYTAVLQDVAALSETQSAGLLLVASVSENVAFQTTEDATATFNVSIADTTAFLDTQTVAAIFLKNVSEAASLSATETATAVFLASLNETVNLSEISTATAVLNTTVFETLNLVDNVAALLTINVSCIESAVLVDFQVGYKNGWTEIDDTQTANWQNISTAQTPGWQGISTAQTPSWQTVSTVQTPSWQDVDTAQAPGWTIIPTQ